MGGLSRTIACLLLLAGSGLALASPTDARPIFGSPELVCGINSSRLDAGVWISPNGLTIYFGTNRNSDGDIFAANRLAIDACFSMPVLIPELSPRSGGPTLSPDELTIWFDSTRIDPAVQELFEATRTDSTIPFNAPRYMAELNLPPYQTSHPSVTADGLELFFFSNRPGGQGSQDIWMATRTSTNLPFGDPVPIADVNSAHDDREPTITPDGLRLYFASDRPGGLGGYDIWTASRPNRTSPFGSPENVTEVNSLTEDAKPGVSFDGTKLYLQSARDGGLGGQDIWVAHRTNNPPIAAAGADQTLTTDANCAATVTLDGSGSFDLDGDALIYTWREGALALAQTSDPVNSATASLSTGTHTITLTVDDGHGGTASDAVVKTVIDSTPPTIGVMSVTPGLLWPPNHRMIPVAVGVSVTDNCDAAACEIISVASNEPFDGLGDGGSAPDWQVTGALTVSLRAERSGTGSGRVYTVTVRCTDASGNSATKAVTVTVPHDQGKK